MASGVVEGAPTRWRRAGDGLHDLHPRRNRGVIESELANAGQPPERSALRFSTGFDELADYPFTADGMSRLAAGLVPADLGALWATWTVPGSNHEAGFSLNLQGPYQDQGTWDGLLDCAWPDATPQNIPATRSPAHGAR